MSSSDIKLPIYGQEERDVPSNKALLDDHRIPTSAVSRETPKKLWPGYIIGLWIVLSSSVILQNAWILSDLKFHYPIWLTTFHLVYATIGTRVLQRFTNLLAGVDDVKMSWDRWFKTIVPIGALFSASLIFSNIAYLHLSVSFIQLKAFTSVAVLLMSVMMGLEKFNRRTAIVVVAISAGVALASLGELNFVLFGFTCQTLGIMFEAARLVAIQQLLSGLKMNPIVSLHFYAPVCAFLNACLIPFFEGSAPFYVVLDRVGIPILILNASTALCLNIAVVFLIGSASSLVLTLSGVLKDILLVAGSVLIMGSTVSFTQMVGYSIALIGLFVFKTKQEVIDQYIVKAKSIVGR